MTTATLPAPAAQQTTATVPDLKAEDVIRADGRYRDDDLVALLGMNPGSLTEKTVQSSRCFTCHFGAWPRASVSGRELLAWINDRDSPIPYEVTELGRRIYNAQKRQEEREFGTPKPAAVTPFDRVLENIENRKEAEKRYDAEQTERMWDWYLALLLKGNDLTDCDVAYLTRFVEDLGITKEQMAEDYKIVKRIRHYEALHEVRDQAERERIAARQKFVELKERHRREFDEEQSNCIRIEAHATQCGNAEHELKMLQKRRPQFMAAGRLKQVTTPDQPTDSDVAA